MQQIQPKISFGIIVLNGEPFLKYNLENIYPYAYEIVIAEGSSPKFSHAASPDGHSIDGTLESLKRFKEENDPEKKIQIVTAEDEGYPNGFWLGEKDEQSQAYAKRCTGNFLWQIDIDEFYDSKDIEKIIELLSETKETTCFTIAAHNYFLSPHIEQVGSYFQHPCFQGEPWGRFRRIFSWSAGWTYYSHRPPTVITSEGKIIHKECKIDLTKKLGVYMHHYSVFSLEQWYSKLAYYKNQSWSFETREGLEEQALLEPSQWKNISNQYRTINSLRYLPDTLKLLDEIYQELADNKTKKIAENIVIQCKNMNPLKKIYCQIISAIDALFRNTKYLIFRKPILKFFLIIERFFIYFGWRNKYNELRRHAQKIN